MVTIKDVAMLAGVSVSTVSIVINGKEKERKVAAKTVEKVLNAVDILGYKPNTAARQLRSSEKNRPVIALFWPLDYRSAFLANILNGVNSELKKLSFDCDIVICTYQNERLYEEKDLSSNHRYDAAIIGATSENDMKFLEKLKTDLPIILFNRKSDKYPSVYSDDTESMENVINLLLSKGHNRIAILCQKNTFIASHNRLSHFSKLAEKLGLKLDENDIITVTDSYEGGSIGAKTFLNIENRPSVVLCTSDIIALGATHVFNKEKIKMPDNLELLSFGTSDINMTLYTTPSISIITVPTLEMASNAVDLAYNYINKNDKSIAHRVCKSQLLLRDSLTL